MEFPFHVLSYSFLFVIQKRGGRANQAPPKPKKSPTTQPESEEAALPTSSSSSSSESEDNEAKGEAAGPSKPRTAPATETKTASITQIVQKSVSSPTVNPTQSTTQVELEPMQVDAVEAEAETLNENSNPEGPKETVMEETIRVTRGRLRKNRSEESR